MRKIKNVICIILASTILISCNNYSEFETEEIMSTSNSEVSHETIPSPDGKLSPENDTDANESKSNKNEAVGTDTVSIDSDKFIYKIWEIKVEEGSDPSLYLSPTFCITSIMDNKIKGKIATGGGPIYCNNSLYEQEFISLGNSSKCLKAQSAFGSNNKLKFGLSSLNISVTLKL